MTTTTMTEMERLLVLEAALVACEGIDLSLMISKKSQEQLEEELNKRFEAAYPDFNKQVKAQTEAVTKFAQHPETYGGNDCACAYCQQQLLQLKNGG